MGEAIQLEMGARSRKPMVSYQDWDIHEGHEGARRIERAAITGGWCQVWTAAEGGDRSGRVDASKSVRKIGRKLVRKEAVMEGFP